jgi:hypothetical protein
MHDSVNCSIDRLCFMRAATCFRYCFGWETKSVMIRIYKESHPLFETCLRMLLLVLVADSLFRNWIYLVFFFFLNAVMLIYKRSISGGFL